MLKHRILILTFALLASPLARGSELISSHGVALVGAISTSSASIAIGPNPCQSRVCDASWLRSEDGTLYRAATPSEIEANQWPEGTHLVLDTLKKTISGNQTVEKLLDRLGGKLSLSIPRADNGAVEAIEFKLAARKQLSMTEFPFDHESPPQTIERTVVCLISWRIPAR
jgi:hypothetical protein